MAGVALLLVGLVPAAGAGAQDAGGGARAPAITATASPTTGLVDGQRITVRGTKPASAAIELKLCPPGTTVAQECARAVTGPVPYERASRWRIDDVVVQRFVTVGAREYDCVTVSCGIGVLDINGGDAIVTELPLRFDDSQPTPARPRFEVDQRTDIPSEGTVTITASGFVPYTSVNVQQCSRPTRCQITSGGYTVDIDGTVVAEVVVNRFVYDDDGRSTDCARPRGCLLSLVAEPAGQRTPRPVRITFADTQVPPEHQPSIELSATEGLLDRQVIEITMRRPPQYFELWQCPAAVASRPHHTTCRVLARAAYEGRPPRRDTEFVLVRRDVLLHDTGEVLADCTVAPRACAIVLTGDGIDRAEDIVPISFVADTPEVAPMITVRGNGTLAPGGARVVITGISDTESDGYFSVSQCPPSFDPETDLGYDCVWVDPRPSFSAPGLVRLRATLPRYLGGPDRIDCTTSPEPCWLLATNEYGERAATELHFSPLPAEPTPTIVVAPSTMLADGDGVRVTINGLTEGTASGDVVQCPSGVRASRTSIERGPNPCRRLSLVDPSDVANGSTTATVYPPRMVGTRANPVDCAQAACELRLWLGTFIFDRQPVSFDPATDVLEPRLEADLPAAGLTDGDTAHVTVTGRSRGQILQCVAGSRTDCRGLTRFTGAPTEVSEEFDVLIRRELGRVDCGSRPGRCELRLMSRDFGAPVGQPLSFDPSDGPVARPRLRLSASDGLSDGQEIEVTVVNPPDEGYALYQCHVTEDDVVAERTCAYIDIGNGRRGRVYEVSHPVTVQRVLEVDDVTPYDCASAPNSCAMVLRPYDNSPERIARLTFT